MARVFGAVSFTSEVSNLRFTESQDELKRLSGLKHFTVGEEKNKNFKIAYCEKERRLFQGFFSRDQQQYFIIGGTPYKDYYPLEHKKIEEIYQQGKLEREVSQMDGAFYIIVIDSFKKCVKIVKDRFGGLPIFFSNSGSQFYFSSFSSLLSFSLGEGKRQPNHKMVARFLINNYAETYGEGHTFYRGVRELQPSHYVLFEGDKVITQMYWDFNPEEPFFERTQEDLGREFRELIDKSVEVTLRDNKAYAFSLSGGMDSGSLIGIAHKLAQEKMPAVSITYHEKARANEIDLIKVLAGQHADPWINIRPKKEEFLKDIVETCKRYDHPWPTGTVYAQERLYRGAHEAGFHSLISGSAGDHHMYGSYPSFLFNFAQLKLENKNEELKKEIQLWMEYHSEPPWIKTEQTVKDFFEKYIDFNNSGLIKSSGEAMVPVQQLLNDEYAKYYRHLSPFPSYGDYNRSYMLKEIRRSAYPPALWSEDIMLWENNLQESAPFWTGELFDLSWKIPHQMKIKGGMNKVMMREVTSDVVPDEVRLRKAKTGFNLPFEVWLKDEKMKNFMIDIFSSQNLKERGVVKADTAMTLLEEHYAGRGSHGMTLWQILNIELWYQNWID